MKENGKSGTAIQRWSSEDGNSSDESYYPSPNDDSDDNSISSNGTARNESIAAELDETEVPQYEAGLNTLHSL